MSQYNPVWSQSNCRSPWPTFHSPVFFPFILKSIWCLKIVMDYPVWHQNKCSSEWPIFLAPVILLLSFFSYGLWVSMTQSWSDFTLTYTFAFLLEVINWVHFILGSWNLLCYLPDLTLQLCARVASRSCPVVRLGIRMYNRSDWAYGK